MKTATASELGGDAGVILRQLRVLEHSYSLLGGVRHRVHALELRLMRRRLRKLMTP